MSKDIFETLAGVSTDSTVAGEDRDDIFKRLRSEEFPVSLSTEPPSDAVPVEAADPGAPEEGEEPLPDAMAVEGEFAPLAVAYAKTPGVSVPLAFPFTAGGVRLRSVTLRPPRLDHVEAFMKDRISRFDVMAEMAGLSPEVFGAMRWQDAERVIAIAADLAPDALFGG